MDQNVATLNQLAVLAARHKEQEKIRNAAEAVLAEIKDEIGSLMVGNGWEKLNVEGYPISVSTTTRSTLDAQLLAENGVDTDIIAKSKRTTTSVSVRVGAKQEAGA